MPWEPEGDISIATQRALKIVTQTSFSSIQNLYYGLRHGESEANVAGIIVSNPADGVENYGLTELGVEQVTKNLSKIPVAFGSNLSIYSSDFLRTAQTAKLAGCRFKVEAEIQFFEALRERFFGSLDGGPDSAYEKIWGEDLESTGHCSFGVESIDSVLARVETLITKIERENSRQKILLVSHGDVLNMLQTRFKGEHANHHRSLKPFAVGELRLLNPHSS